ncbi:nucleotidyltransferase [Actinomadura hibisca]|uniref:nucleotidyltransferase n=1 Tax=Actinomadura hibisca TaxID=68565 RepID=UPI000AEB1F8D|nr:nucleotidyltransferase [Actinomadura hibisca]
MGETSIGIEPSQAAAESLLLSLKRAAAVLEETGVPFALAGGFAAYARGAAQSTHDVDFVLRESDVDTAQQALVAAGMRPQECPENWLAKVYDGDQLIDLIFAPTSRPVDDELLGRAEMMSVAAVRMPVLRADDMVVMRLLAFSETACDFSGFLHVCRALREQVDWPRVAAETAESPYAYAFLALLARLGVIEGDFL